MTLETILQLMGGYCMIFSILGVIKGHRTSYFYSAFVFCVGIFLYFYTPLQPEVSISLLIIGPLYHLFLTRLARPVEKLDFVFAYALPSVIWIVILLVDAKSAWLLLDTAVFLTMLIFGTMSVATLHSVSKRYASKNVPLPQMMVWMQTGLYIVLVVGFASSIIEASSMAVVAVISLGVYTIGGSMFAIQFPKSLDLTQLRAKEQTNLEEEIKRRLAYLMDRKKLYSTPDLTLQELAGELDLKPAQLSNFFNVSMGANFNDVINSYRIAEVKRLIEHPSTDKKATLMELAYAAGFNSKASFNRVFKTVTGMTPKEYRQSITSH